MQQTHTPRPALHHFLAAAALGLGLGSAGASFAVGPTPAGEERAGSEWGAAPLRGHAEHRFARDWGRELSRLHAGLKLDATQEALWQSAEQGTREARKELGERLRAEHRKTLAALAAPDADLRSILSRMDEQRAEGEKRRLADRERWLAVYDSLNPTQKEQARAFLRQQIDRHDARSERGDRGDRGNSRR